MRPASWLYLVPTAAALVWQVQAAIGSEWSTVRTVTCALAATTMAWAGPLRPDRTPATWARVWFSLSAAVVAWVTVLEIAILRTPVLARGVLLVVAAASLHATILLVATRPPRGAPASGGLALRLGLSLTMVAWLSYGLEAAFRAISPPVLHDVIPDDPKAGSMLVRGPGGHFRGRPGFRGQYIHPEFPGSRVELNAWGLRDDPEEASPPEPGSYSVLALGDSFVFGTGVTLDETYQELLETRAAEITERPVRVYGAGIPGYAPLSQLALLRALAERTEPDVVIAAVFEGNDFQDGWAAERRRGNEEVVGAGDLDASVEPMTIERYLDGISRFRFWAATSSAMQMTRLDGLLLELGLVDPIARGNKFFDIALLAEPPPLVARMRDQLIKRLGDMAKDCEARDTDFVVLIIPDAIQVDPVRFAAYPLPGGTAAPDLSRLAFHESFVSALRSRGWRVVDTLSVLETETAAGNPCYHHEGHWNARGHRIAADLLTPVLAELSEDR